MLVAWGGAWWKSGFPAAPAAGEGSQALGGGTELVGPLSRKFSGTPPRFGTPETRVTSTGFSCCGQRGQPGGSSGGCGSVRCEPRGPCGRSSEQRSLWGLGLVGVTMSLVVLGAQPWWTQRPTGPSLSGSFRSHGLFQHLRG